jgi:hypothetical protein
MSFRGEGGYIFFDREVKTGGQFEVGITGRIRAKWLGDVAKGCKLLAEAEVCPHVQNQDFSALCSSSDAVEQ